MVSLWGLWFTGDGNGWYCMGDGKYSSSWRVLFTLGGYSPWISCEWAVGWFLAEPLFSLLGASGDYLRLALSYIKPLFLGAVFFLLSSMSNAILLAHGDSKTFGRVLVIGFFANLVVDPWFLYGGFGLPAMGMAGIAWATVSIQAVGGFYLLSVVIRRGYLVNGLLGGFWRSRYLVC
jgi:Na+-driven multidrug efflux pump